MSAGNVDMFLVICLFFLNANRGECDREGHPPHRRGHWQCGFVSARARQPAGQTSSRTTDTSARAAAKEECGRRRAGCTGRAAKVQLISPECSIFDEFS